VLDYDKEAARYDATRGGDARADAAAEAIATLLAGTAGLIVDLACGTGIVTTRLAGPGRRVLGIDRSAGMAGVAAGRLPGRVAVGDATRVPLPSGSADAVTLVWLLHLLGRDDSERVIAEAARVLRPGGLLITTVDKNEAACLAGDDAAQAIWQVRADVEPVQSDAAATVSALARRYGLEEAGEATFTGAGQGVSPRARGEQLRASRAAWVAALPADRVARLSETLAALPDQDRARENPVYKLLSLRKTLPHD
jgi:ubiquinone/menaquinone biosynthesis C-methylase UbiE